VAKILATLLGIALLAIGLVGVVSGGDDHRLLIFGINAGHNTVHLVSGAVALAMAMISERAAMLFCLAFGSIYGVVAVAGFFQLPIAVRTLNLNMPDNFLHLGIAVVCLWVGGLSKGE
jgi:Domain of unknown function (DUF4383)